MFEMFLVPEVRTGPMDPREHNLGVMFSRVTGHPFAELHVVADDEKARIYFFAPRVGAFVCVAHAYAGGAPFVLPVLLPRPLSLEVDLERGILRGMRTPMLPRCARDR